MTKEVFCVIIKTPNEREVIKMKNTIYTILAILIFVALIACFIYRFWAIEVCTNFFQNFFENGLTNAAIHAIM